MCSFASATRNMVPGRTEVIVPSTSMAFSEFIMIDRASRPRKTSGAGCARSNYLPALLRETLATAATRWARPLFASAGFVDGERTPTDFFAVQCGHSRPGFGVVVHGDEGETARLAGHAVHHQRHFADFAVLF